MLNVRYWNGWLRLMLKNLIHSMLNSAYVWVIPGIALYNRTWINDDKCYHGIICNLDDLPILCLWDKYVWMICGIFSSCGCRHQDNHGDNLNDLGYNSQKKNTLW